MNNQEPTKTPIAAGLAFIQALFSQQKANKANPEAPSRTDAQGRIHPANIISDIDAARDDMVNTVVAQFKAEQALLRQLKLDTFNNIDAFLAYSLEHYHVKLGGEKHGCTLTNFNQTSKIVISYAQRIMFTEELMAAKLLIEQLIEEKSDGVDDITKALLMNAFNLNNGLISTAEILKLRRIEIKHPLWEEAMQAINNAILPIGNKGYVRVYQRADIDSKWEAIPLDMAAL